MRSCSSSSTRARGIKREDLPKIFEPFSRQAARARHRPRALHLLRIIASPGRIDVESHVGVDRTSRCTPHRDENPRRRDDKTVRPVREARLTEPASTPIWWGRRRRAAPLGRRPLRHAGARPAPPRLVGLECSARADRGEGCRCCAHAQDAVDFKCRRSRWAPTIRQKPFSWRSCSPVERSGDARRRRPPVVKVRTDPDTGSREVRRGGGHRAHPQRIRGARIPHAPPRARHSRTLIHGVPWDTTSTPPNIVDVVSRGCARRSTTAEPKLIHTVRGSATS